MFDEEEEFLPEEKYERIMQPNSEANSRIDSYGDESGAFELERSERESNHDRTEESEEVVDRASSSHGTEDADDHQEKSGGPVSAGILLVSITTVCSGISAEFKTAIEYLIFIKTIFFFLNSQKSPI